jgi:hypothetical protein
MVDSLLVILLGKRVAFQLLFFGKFFFFFFFFFNKEACASSIAKSHETLQIQNDGYKTLLHPKSETNLTKQLSKQYTNIT